MTKGLYTQIWRSVVGRICNALADCTKPSIQLDGKEFLAAGNRQSYTFSAQFVKGKRVSSNNGSAVARDLGLVLENNYRFQTLARDRNVIIRMGRDFSLRVEMTPEITMSVSHLDINSTTAKQEMQVHSLPPIVFDDSEILILGTMPGKTSLETGEYYSQKGNVMWEIIEVLFNNNNRLSSYQEKIECLKRNQIALWDALSSCERVDSLDSSIEHPIPNDIDMLLHEHPSIKKIVFNGRKASDFYHSKLPSHIALSTSQANCQYSTDIKVKSWRNALTL